MSSHRKGQKAVTRLATSKQGQAAIAPYLPIPRPFRKIVTRGAIQKSGTFQRRMIKPYMRFLPKSLTGVEFVDGDYDYDYDDAGHGVACSAGACVIL